MKIERLPPEQQDKSARKLVGLADDDDDDAEGLEPEHRAAIEEGRQQAARGEFSPLSAEEAVRAAFRTVGR